MTIITGEFKTQRRYIAAVSAELAAALDRPAQAHIVEEDFEWVEVKWTDDDSGSGGWALVAQRRIVDAETGQEA